MRILIAIISGFIFLTASCFAQENTQEPNYIYWSNDYKLDWSDFEELPHRFSEHAAYSVVGYESQFHMNDNEYSAVVKTYFSKNESWSKSWVSLLLVHEQGHFDMAELYARRFRKRLKEAMKADNVSIEKFRQMSDETIEQLEVAQ